MTMNKDFIIKGESVILKFPKEEDASVTLKIRNNSTTNSIIPKINNDLHEQETWLANEKLRSDSFFFLICSLDFEPIGTIGVYNIKSNFAEWGRWINNVGGAAGISALYSLLYFSFEILKLDFVYSQSFSENSKVLRIHQSISDEFLDFDDFAKINNLIKLENSVPHKITQRKWDLLQTELFSNQNNPILVKI